MAMWFEEEFAESMRLGFRVKRTLFAGQSDYQRVEIVETDLVGKALAIDGLWMTSERDEKYYHELLVHPVMCTAPKIERVLIIGGGDGGTAREVLRYPEVKHVDMVEIDGMVVEACQQYLPEIGTAWDDPRLQVHITDGVAWVKREDLAPYDVILVDGSDPVGPAVGLFNAAFFQACADKLNPGGVFATQNESPELFKEVHLDALRVMKAAFAEVHPYYGNVMLYPGGLWSWAFASQSVLPGELIEARVQHIEPQTEIYNADIHRGAFAVPNFIKRALQADPR